MMAAGGLWTPLNGIIGLKVIPNGPSAAPRVMIGPQFHVKA
jgi:hypothetical protein